MTAILWRDKRDNHTFMELESVEGKFCNEQWKGMKLLIMEDYVCHMHYVDNGDRMASSYSLSLCTQKWTRKLLFHLLEWIFQKVVFFFSYNGKKISQGFLMCPYKEYAGTT